jgi:NAD(P)H dehydrogenase (quinone)
VGRDKQGVVEHLPKAAQLCAHCWLTKVKSRGRLCHIPLGQESFKSQQQIEIEAPIIHSMDSKAEHNRFHICCNKGHDADIANRLESRTVAKKVLIVYAHPEPTSLTRQLVDVSIEALTAQGHEVILSDLYGMRWKAVFDADDFPCRTNPERLSYIMESGHAYATGQQTADVAAEQAKLLGVDAVILQFPLWWYGLPAILKGWIDRVYAFGFAYGYKNGTNEYRFGDGILKGKRALVNVMAGGPAADYGPRGINGPIDQLLFPLTHGALFYPGMDVLPTHAVYGAGHVATAEEVDAIKAAWRLRLAGLFIDKPIPFRSQNGGDFPDRHAMADHVAPGQTGLVAHVANLVDA